MRAAAAAFTSVCASLKIKLISVQNPLMQVNDDWELDPIHCTTGQEPLKRADSDLPT